MKYLFAVGGTGGHLYPAQATALSLRKKKDSQMLFAGSGLKTNPYVNPETFACEEVPAAPFKGNLWQKAKALLINLKGFLKARALIKSFRPDVVIGFGSYHSFPVLLAAKWMGVPIVLHEANAIAGKVVRYFAPFAKATGIHFPLTKDYLSGRCVEVGMPLRDGYTRAFGSKEKARSQLMLDSDRMTILSFGGSQGALAINTAFCAAVMDLADRSNNFQIIHLTGDAATAKECRQLYKELGIPSYVKAFEDRMDTVWLAADIFVARAGAGTIAEHIAFEVPGILIPYPYAADDHQEANARFVLENVGSIEKIAEANLLSEHLAKTLYQFLENNQARLDLYRERIVQYKKRKRSRDLSSLIEEVAGLSYT